MSKAVNKEKVTAEQFVLAWQSAASFNEVLQKLDLPEKTIRSRAAYYRRKGVKLKKWRLGRKRLDVAALNKLIEETNNEKQD
jgi:hypothetical protein